MTTNEATSVENWRGNVARIILASSGRKRENKSVKPAVQKRSKRLISPLYARLQPRRSRLRRECPTPRPVHWLCPDLDCLCRAQSCRHRFDAARPFVRGLACSNFLLPDAVATPRQKHRKIPNGDGASRNAATSWGITRIRLYSCRYPVGRYADFQRDSTDTVKPYFK